MRRLLLFSSSKGIKCSLLFHFVLLVPYFSDLNHTQSPVFPSFLKCLKKWNVPPSPFFRIIKEETKALKESGDDLGKICIFNCTVLLYFSTANVIHQLFSLFTIIWYYLWDRRWPCFPFP